MNIELASKCAAIEKIATDWKRLLEMGAGIADRKISFVNLGREIGLTMMGVCQHEQMRLSFYENIKSDLPEGLTFQAVQKCIQIAHALPQPAQTLAEANRVEEQLFLAGGFMELPHRDGLQKSRDVSVAVFFFNTLSSTKDRLLKRLDEAPTWNEATKENIRAQVKSFREALAQIESKL